MGTDVLFLAPIEKLNLNSTLKSTDIDDPDAVERCPKNRYIRYNEMLGRGAFKTVYKGFDEVEGIEIAWNQVMLDDAMQSPEHLERVKSEVYLLKSLKHDNIIKSYGSWVDEEKNTFNMITELFTSGNLRQYRKKHKNVDLKAIKNWARQILQGLVYLHTREPPVIHRDLKCDNIFVNGNHGEVKIGDLGLATLMIRPAAKSLIGTPEFMAPELYEEEYNELVDIYSFGMCILELITCEYPYSECRNQAHIYKKVTSGIKPAGLSKVKDPQVKEFIEKCLVPVSQRLSAKELLKDPFLSSESKIERVHEAVKVNLVKLQNPILCSMDIDHGDNKLSSGSSSVKSNADSQPLSPVELELQFVDEIIDLRLKGGMLIDNSFDFTLRIDTGIATNIHFTFYLDVDTAHTIAQEMVEQLELEYGNVAVMGKLIDDFILKFVPTWKRSSSRGGMSSPEGSVIIQNGQEKVPEPEDCGYKGSVNSSFTYSGDWMKSSGGFSDDSSDKNTSNDFWIGVCEDLKREINAIEAQYNERCSELQKYREGAIEDAKRKWASKKKLPVF